MSSGSKGLIRLKIISKFNSDVFRSSCKAILFTSESGEFEVLADHIPMIANIKENSAIRIIDENNEQHFFEVSSSKGYFAFNYNECLITVAECRRTNLENSVSNASKQKAS